MGNPPSSQKRKRRRNIIWFNPPYNRNIQNNIGREFISLIQRSFPSGHKLRKIFNRNTLKLSYSCMPSVKQIIDGHNKAILKKAETTTLQRDKGKKCNCRKKEDCSLNGEQLQGKVWEPSDVLRHEKRESETELSKHIWQLKGENKEFKVTWKILAKAKPYTNITKRCDLCNTEKFFLICRPHMATLNKRNELISTCRHRHKFILRFKFSTSKTLILARALSEAS